MSVIDDIKKLLDTLSPADEMGEDPPPYSSPTDICTARMLGTLAIELRSSITQFLKKGGADEIVPFYEALLVNNKLTPEHIQKIKKILNLYENDDYEKYILCNLAAPYDFPKTDLQTKKEQIKTIDEQWDNTVNRLYEHLLGKKIEVLDAIQSLKSTNQYLPMVQLVNETFAESFPNDSIILAIATINKRLFRFIEEASPSSAILPLLPYLLRQKAFKQTLDEKTKPSKLRAFLSKIPIIKLFISPLTKEQEKLKNAITTERRVIDSTSAGDTGICLIFNSYIEMLTKMPEKSAKHLETPQHSHIIKESSTQKEPHADIKSKNSGPAAP